MNDISKTRDFIKSAVIVMLRDLSRDSSPCVFFFVRYMPKLAITPGMVPGHLKMELRSNCYTIATRVLIQTFFSSLQ